MTIRFAPLLASKALLAAARTPPQRIEKISADVQAVLADEAVKQRCVNLGGVPRGSTAAQLSQLIAADRQRYARIIAERKITVD
jgi:tripartite-type tricarboxylate transporter receptor subunit TctC